jgi:NADPH:quinone reductase-like Zn-dependent oxidoreductase
MWHARSNRLAGTCRSFKPGDEAFGGCRGAFAEHACAPESALAKPDNVTFEQAGSVPVAALTALQGLRDKRKIQPGQKALVNGAAGGVGPLGVSSLRGGCRSVPYGGHCLSVPMSRLGA